MIQHKHLIVRAKVNKPPDQHWGSYLLAGWFCDLIHDLGMKLLAGPLVEYVELEGNRGVTAVCIIETSHIAMHVWDEQSPALMQLDVYTCGPLDPKIVFKAMEAFEPVTIEHKFLDREHGLVEV